ncbi:MBL fold metallo-hydrolase [Arthrobacter roseus]|uniref:MBL fold metallo-hydrolase n=1 Tax=Arthrobacter roseus TaxID=136274 RepID=UPI001966CC18|nr:MBL fold metallo-hydrolase [Arthrobacter roseus]MBM7848735.1 glyoxylase-like metal-dependent hydrolase (beta-lactamase superfamily II) [Arthrobacter roseus]
MITIDNAVTSGTFSLDGGTWDVDNNVWIVGDDNECIIIDAPHDIQPILTAISGRTVKAILLTHAHDDHIGAALELQKSTGAPIHLHSEDRMLWDRVYPDHAPDGDVADGDTFDVAGVQLTALHTPGHSPGSVSYHLPSEKAVFTGDTLFNGGPGATGRSYSDFPTIINSIRDRLFVLPGETVVRTGHGDSTTIGAESPHLEEWIRQGA